MRTPIPLQRIRLYRPKTKGTRCECFFLPKTPCTSCHQTGIIGGYDDVGVVEVMEDRHYHYTSIDFLDFFADVKGVIPKVGDVFLYDGKKRVVRQTMRPLDAALPSFMFSCTVLQSFQSGTTLEMEEPK